MLMERSPRRGLTLVGTPDPVLEPEHPDTRERGRRRRELPRARVSAPVQPVAMSRSRLPELRLRCVTPGDLETVDRGKRRHCRRSAGGRSCGLLVVESRRFRCARPGEARGAAPPEVVDAARGSVRVSHERWLLRRRRQASRGRVGHFARSRKTKPSRRQTPRRGASSEPFERVSYRSPLNPALKTVSRALAMSGCDRRASLMPRRTRRSADD